MPDIKQVLSEEIRRLARKELKSVLAPIVSQLSEQRKVIAELKREIAALKKNIPAAEEKAEATVVSDAKNEAGKLRLSAAGIVKIRKKLGLTQGQLAELLNVSAHTVSLWEVGKVSPRSSIKMDICSFRTIGKKELKQRLAALKTEE